jgi:hypothetical protein
MSGARAFPNRMAREIADVLHRLTCGWNHTDGCSYFMDKWNGLRSPTKQDSGSYSWEDHEHAYKAALKIIAAVPVSDRDSLKKIIKMLDRYRVS